MIIVSYNTADLLEQCLASVIAQTRGLSHEIIVVDNASRDDSVARVRRRFPQVRLIEAGANLGFGAANNLAAQQACGEFLLLLNSDALLLHDTASLLVDCLRADAGLACVGPRVVLPSLHPQPQAFGHLPTPWRLLMQAVGGAGLGLRGLEGVDGRLRGAGEQDVGWLSGVCLCLRRQDFLAVGGFDPRFFMYAEDVALCARLWRQVGRVRLIDRGDVLHYGGASSPGEAVRVRNAVWQQRHILQVCRDEFGTLAAAAGRLAVGLGLVLRLAAARLRRRGGDPLLRATSRARLQDLLGRGQTPAGPPAAWR